MTARPAGRAAAALGAVALLLAISGLACGIGAGNSLDTGMFNRLASAIVYVSLGVVIAQRQPRNSIGWIFCAIGILGGLGLLSRGYTELWLAKGVGPDLLGRTVAVYDSAAWVLDLAVPTTFLLLLFPDGRLPSRRWIPVAGCAAIGTLGFLVAQLLYPGPLDHHTQVVNPYGVSHGVSNALNALFLMMLTIGIVGSAAAPVARFRHESPTQRNQIKWMALAAALVGTSFIVVFFAPLYLFVGEDTAGAVLLFSVLSFPIAAAFGMLRYRLYDVDVVINRALVYGALTATLVGFYLGSVLLLQLLLDRFTQGSGFAVAASTLAAAAVVRPARAHIQAIVDRRFYRRKYDAAQTLAHFGARLRDQIDLDTLQVDLRTVVSETMQPEHVTLWLRTPKIPVTVSGRSSRRQE